MADTERLRRTVQSPAPFSTWLGVVLLFALFGAIVLAVMGPMPRTDSYEQIRAKKRVDLLKTTRETDEKALSGYGWVDKNKGLVRLPIERAIEITATELANKKPAPAYAIATPEAQLSTSAAPSGAAKASPAPAASALPSESLKPVSVAGPESANRGQPAAATNPAPVPPSTQPGASAAPAASPRSSAAVAPVSPSPSPSPSAAGSPLPVRGATPGQ